MKRRKLSAKKIRERQALQQQFNEAGLRLTRQRHLIYRELMGRYDHPDVDTLYRAVKPRLPRISLFTVYRTMNALENAGMIWRVATWKGHARYDGNAQAHVHFLCETCGKLEDIHEDIGQGSLVPSAEFKGTVNRVEVKLTGECEGCAARRGAAESAAALA